MIGKMHEKTNGFAFKVIFSLVSLSFVLGGIGGTLIGTDTSAVKVNGEEISQRAFNEAKARQQNRLNSEMGERFWDAMENPIYAKQFHDSIFNSLINDELLRQYAQTLKLGISAEQIKSEIVNSPAFQENGKFSNALYQQTLRNNGLSADGYAYIVNEGMLFSQLQEGILGTTFDVPAQQELLAKLLLQKRDVRLATFSLADEIQKQTATTEELQQYYDKHKGEFINPETLSVEYITLSSQDIEKNVKVTDEQVETYYNTNKAQYVVPSEVRVAHIQFADEAEANTALQALNRGQDFATLAKEKSKDSISATQGGDLGWAKAGTFPTNFENAVMALQVGQISPIVKVDNAFHIIKVLDRKAESTVPLAQVKSAIVDTIRGELVLTDYANMVREMSNVAFENSSSLEKVAEISGQSLQKTALFTRENVPALLSNDATVKALFHSELRQNGQNSEAIEIGDQTHPKTLFIRVNQYQAESEQTFEQAKTTVEYAVKQEKATQTLMAKAEENVKALQEGKQADVKFAPNRQFVFAKAQLSDPVLSQAVFKMPKPANQSQYQTARNVAGDVIVIALDKVIDGNLDQFKPFAERLQEANQQALRTELLNALREQAKIEFNSDFMEQFESNQP